MNLDDSIKKSFEEKFIPEPNSGCWLWIASYKGSTYGQFCIRRKTLLAHRVSFALYKGPIPEGMFVCHSCDVPSCVNPEHLFLGTPSDNMQDMLAKGRCRPNAPRGEAHKDAKLTEEKVKEIRTLYEKGLTQMEISGMYNVTFQTIGSIVRRQTWRHIEHDISTS